MGIAVFYTVVSRLFEAMGDLSQFRPPWPPGRRILFSSWSVAI